MLDSTKIHFHSSQFLCNTFHRRLRIVYWTFGHCKLWFPKTDVLRWVLPCFFIKNNLHLSSYHGVQVMAMIMVVIRLLLLLLVMTWHGWHEQLLRRNGTQGHKSTPGPHGGKKGVNEGTWLHHPSYHVLNSSCHKVAWLSHTYSI